jgi:hypothetical protein
MMQQKKKLLKDTRQQEGISVTAKQGCVQGSAEQSYRCITTTTTVAVAI